MDLYNKSAKQTSPVSRWQTSIVQTLEYIARFKKLKVGIIIYVGKEKSNLKYVSIVLYNLSPTFKNVSIVSYSTSLFLNPCFTYFIGCVFLPYQASRHLEEFRLTTLQRSSLSFGSLLRKHECAKETPKSSKKKWIACSCCHKEGHSFKNYFIHL